jgi:hypothetical protein
LQHGECRIIDWETLDVRLVLLNFY